MLKRIQRKLLNGAVALFKRSSSEFRDSLNLANYARANVLPLPPAAADEQKWIPVSRLGLAGIDLREAEQVERIGRWKSEKYQRAFARLRGDPAINTERVGHTSLANGWYNTPDAEIYSAMILDRQPRRIIEVGAGFSTRIARATALEAGLKTQITVVDPQPRTDIQNIVDEAIIKPVEKSGLAERDWRPGDLLFVDSSHICRTRGDVPYLFCELIPRLPAGVLVHVHDIYLPFDYPNNLDARCYTEQYILHSLLSHSPRYRTMITSHWLSRTHPDRMREVFGNEAARDVRHYGGCYWFEIV